MFTAQTIDQSKSSNIPTLNIFLSLLLILVAKHLPIILKTFFNDFNNPHKMIDEDELILESGLLAALNFDYSKYYTKLFRFDICTARWCGAANE